MTSQPRTTAATAVAPTVALLVVGLALRPQLAAIGPLADSIIADLGVSHAYVGLLTAIPVLCMGLFALFGPSLAHVAGVRAGIAWAVGVLVLFAILRTLVPGAALLLVLTFGVGVGTGLVGPLLPMFVRGRLPLAMVAGTAAYAAGTLVGAATGSGIAVPLEQVTGGWRGSLLVLSVASVVALVAWLALVRGMPVVAAGQREYTPGPEPAAARRSRLLLPELPLRRPVAWAVGLLFGLQSSLYYGVTTWLAKVYVERGWDPVGAAVLLAVVSAAGLAAIVGVPVLSRRGASRRSLMAGATGMVAVGLVGVAFVPDPALLWTVLMGSGLGATFTLVLTLPTDIGHGQREVGGAAAMMLLVGYLIAAVAPFALGVVRDATGDFTASLWALVVVALVMIPLAWSLAPHRLRPVWREVVD